MEGLNRPDNNRTNWNTSDYGIRELRAERSYPGSTAEVSRRKARSLSRSVVSHLRWDLNAIFKMAAEDTIIQGNPAGSLVTPKEAKTAAKRTMTKEQVRLALSVLDLRERIIFLLAVLVGMRPGEILALRCSAAENCYATSMCRVRTETSMHRDLYPRKCRANSQPRRQDLEATPLASCRARSLGRPEDPGKRVERSRSSVNQPLPSLGHKEGVDPKVAADQ